MKDTQPAKTNIFTPQIAEADTETALQKPQRSGLPVSLSLILLGVAIIIGGIIVGWTSFFQNNDNIEISLESVSTQPTGTLEMTGARYSGTTENGVEFSINADRAVESADEKGLVVLYEPDGFVSSESDGRTNLSSNSALYYATERRLDMSGNVNIYQAKQNLTLKSEEIVALIGKGEMLSNKPVILEGPDIFLTSQGMHATDNGEVIKFTGKSRVELKQN
ncbi:MAG: LPS export ABC transporter periplasmic protein LptC [Alphaproteobacteria bacterium]|nr:LPS export ABC transporter periplasmic protein LptC [Alphaproteobacteria bacterium]MBL6776647.1 LPS export ABC transporter periplasmic protein LptC [Alphaproteobacteria bacterium]